MRANGAEWFSSVTRLLEAELGLEVKTCIGWTGWHSGDLMLNRWWSRLGCLVLTQAGKNKTKQASEGLSPFPYRMSGYPGSEQTSLPHLKELPRCEITKWSFFILSVLLALVARLRDSFKRAEITAHFHHLLEGLQGRAFDVSWLPLVCHSCCPRATCERQVWILGAFLFSDSVLIAALFCKCLLWVRCWAKSCSQSVLIPHSLC